MFWTNCQLQDFYLIFLYPVRFKSPTTCVIVLYISFIFHYLSSLSCCKLICFHA